MSNTRSLQYAADGPCRYRGGWRSKKSFFFPPSCQRLFSLQTLNYQCFFFPSRKRKNVTFSFSSRWDVKHKVGPGSTRSCQLFSFFSLFVRKEVVIQMYAWHLEKELNIFTVAAVLLWTTHLLAELGFFFFFTFFQQGLFYFVNW